MALPRGSRIRTGRRHAGLFLRDLIGVGTRIEFANLGRRRQDFVQQPELPPQMSALSDTDYAIVWLWLREP